MLIIFKKNSFFKPKSKNIIDKPKGKNIRGNNFR